MVGWAGVGGGVEGAVKGVVENLQRRAKPEPMVRYTSQSDWAPITLKRPAAL